MTLLENHAQRYWKSSKKLRSGVPLSRQFALDNELPELMADTPFAKLKVRISKELNNANSSTKQSS